MEAQKEEAQEFKHSHLQSCNGTTFLKTCLNGVNAMSEVGILSVPYALSEGGWIGLVLLLVMAVVCYYTGILLRRCVNAHSLIKTYPDIGELAFGYKGKLTIALLMYLELYLVAIEFLILEGDNLDKLFPNTKLKIAKLKIEGKQGFTLLAALSFLPTTWLRSLGLLAYVSAGGVLASIILVVCVFFAGAVGDVGFHQRGQLINWRGMPTSASLFAFCYCGHAVFPTLCTSMKDKSRFPKVLVICFIICTLNYGSIAILGYLMFGEGVKSQVTLNLPVKGISSKIAIYTTLVNPFTKYAIMITPIASTIEDQFPFQKSRSISLLIRTVLVISTVVVALSIPFFGYLMALIGAFLSATVSILLPCICYLKISKTYRVLGFELFIIISILVLASLVAILGTFTSLKQIIEHL